MWLYLEPRGLTIPICDLTLDMRGVRGGSRGECARVSTGGKTGMDGDSTSKFVTCKIRVDASFAFTSVRLTVEVRCGWTCCAPFNRQHALAGRCGCRVTDSAGRAPVTAPDHDELTRFTSPWPWPFMVACKIRFEARGGWTRCALTESQFSCSPKAFSCTYARVTHLPIARQCTTPYARAFFGSSLRSLFMRHMLSLFSSSPPPARSKRTP